MLLAAGVWRCCLAAALTLPRPCKTQCMSLCAAGTACSMVCWHMALLTVTHHGTRLSPSAPQHTHSTPCNPRCNVRDSSGPDGTSLLKEDSLPLELLPGPASVLAFEGPSELASGSRGLLGQLAVTACDDWGNVVEELSTEVSLVPAALAADGHAAKVSAAGGNRAKLKKGAQTHSLRLGGLGCAGWAGGGWDVSNASASQRADLSSWRGASSTKQRLLHPAACQDSSAHQQYTNIRPLLCTGRATWRDVRLAAEQGPGTYLITASAVSRKVCVRDATLPVVVSADNLVTALEVVQASLPQPGTAVGGGVTVQVGRGC